MTQENQKPDKKNGIAAAAMISSMIGILSLSVSHTLSVLSQESKLMIHEIGKAWIPGADAIGPYSGKETIMLIGWGVSWIILHYALRNRDVKLSYYTIVFMIGVGIAILLVWTPFVHLITNQT
ncbi:MAG: hypothetical protein OEM28_03640 [Nitrosopumilus sp.]|nr:hypothetical protein [Nitrosopumilus sp.]